MPERTMPHDTRPSSGRARGSRVPPRLLSIGEVADVLGVQVRHVRRLVAERRIPYVKWGHLLRFDPEEIAEWIDDNRHQPTGGL